MNRVVFLSCTAIAAGGLLIGTTDLSLAGTATHGSIEWASPVSRIAPDLVTIGPVGQSPDHSKAVAETFHSVSPSIIAEIGPEPEPARQSGENGKRKRFDAAPLVIRAGMIGGAAPIQASAAAQPEPSGDEQHPASESDGKAPAADQGKPLTAPR